MFIVFLAWVVFEMFVRVAAAAVFVVVILL